MYARNATSTALPNSPINSAAKIEDSTPVRLTAPNPTIKVIAAKGPLLVLFSICFVVSRDNRSGSYNVERLNPSNFSPISPTR